jgi:TonB family protein
MVDYYSFRTKQYGAMLTIILHGIVLLILILGHIITPIPPYPDGGGGSGNGIELNLGFSDVGSGTTPLEMPTIAEVAKPVEAVTIPDKGKLATQDMEDVPKIKEQEVSETKKVKKETKKVVAEAPVKEVKKEAVKQPVVNAHALYKGNKTSADGTDKTPGDKGDPSGSLAAKAFGGKNGSGGTGGGTGGGDGTGKGTGTGPGVSFNLKDRKPMSLPKPEYKHQVEGVVVVEVTVNIEGKVTQAIPGAKGSTTLDESLLDAAKQAALQAHFDKKPDAATFQKGTITYRFRLQ